MDTSNVVTGLRLVGVAGMVAVKVICKLKGTRFVGQREN